MTLTTVQNNPFNYVSFETSFGSAPRGGQKALGVTAQFSATATQIDFDLSQAHQEGKLEFVQAIYCDNSVNPNSVSIKCRVTEQVLTWAPYTQGYLPCLSTNVNKFTATSTNNYVGNVNFIFLNHPIPADTWSVLSPATGSGTGGSASVGTIGQIAPSSADQIGFNNSGGNLTNVSNANPLPVTTVEEEIWCDDAGVLFVYRDTSLPGASSLTYTAYKIPQGTTYIPQGNPRHHTIDNVRGNYTSYPASNISVVTATLATAGTGYAIDDLITLAGGTNSIPAVARVTAVTAGGAIASVSFACLKGATIGAYSAAPTNPVSQASTTGSGTGATFTITTATNIAMMVDTTGFAACQFSSTSGQGGSTKTMQGSTDNGLSWQTIGWTYGATNAYVTSNPSADFFYNIALINAPPPLIRLVLGSTVTANYTVSWALREEPVEPTAQTVSQGQNNGSNIYWLMTQQASNFGPPRTYTTVISAASTNATLISSSSRTFYSIVLGNSGTAAAYLKLYSKNTAPIPGTDTPYAVYPILPGAMLVVDVGSMGFQDSSATLGVGYAITGAPALNDATALPTAGTITGTLLFT